jgi:osmotically-inducible protein OsmY
MFDRPDDQIGEHVAEVLASPRWGPEGHHVTAEVRDGLVILDGTVRDRGDVSVVCDIVHLVPGVVEVEDRLRWETSDPKPSHLHDTDPR